MVPPVTGVGTVSKIEDIKPMKQYDISYNETVSHAWCMSTNEMQDRIQKSSMHVHVLVKQSLLNC